MHERVKVGLNLWFVPLLWGGLLLMLVMSAGYPVKAEPIIASKVAPPSDISSKLWDQLLQIDSETKQVQDLSVRFVKLKRTPLLRKPLTSNGRVRIKSDKVRWDTQWPHQVITLIDDGQVTMYMPGELRAEIYELDDRLPAAIASPIPRFTDLALQFTIEQQAPKHLFDDLSAKQMSNDRGVSMLALRLHPRDEQIRKVVSRIDLLLETQHGRLVRLRLFGETNQTDTEYRFSDWSLNSGIDDAVFELTWPKDVQVIRPLQGDS